MSALATRLLVLGVVRIFEPANAYQLRRELLSWEVDRWANINPGSVYGMLTSLEKAGLVRRHDLVGVNGRAVGVYTTTEEGATEFPLLVERALRTVEDWVDVTDLRAALSMVPFVPRAPVVEAVGERISALSAIVDRMTGLRAGEAGAKAVPPHVLEGFDLERSLAAVQLAWLHRYRDLVVGGAFLFAGEAGWDWMPAEDDPGWAMVRDRQHYLPQLADEG